MADMVRKDLKITHRIQTGNTPNKTGKNKSKVVVVILIILCVLGLFLLYGYLTNRVVESTPGMAGNTAGNLYNGGMFCINDGRIYFSNPNDDFTLYSMSDSLQDYKKLYNDYSRYINVDENYVYYTRMNNKKDKPSQSIFVFYNTGVYRISKTGKNINVITSEPSGSLLLYDNKLYYQKMKGNSLTLFRTGIDGKNEIKIFSDDTPVASAFEDKIYYSGILNEKNIHYITTSGSTLTAFETNAYLPIATSEGIFYVSTDDNYKLYLSDFDGSNSKVIVDMPISRYYNITPDLRYVIYQCDTIEKKGIYVLDRTEGTTDIIAEGSYKWINIAGSYCFFYDFSGQGAYSYDFKEKKLSVFDPPALKR